MTKNTDKRELTACIEWECSFCGAIETAPTIRELEEQLRAHEGVHILEARAYLTKNPEQREPLDNYVPISDGRGGVRLISQVSLARAELFAMGLCRPVGVEDRKVVWASTEMGK